MKKQMFLFTCFAILTCVFVYAGAGRQPVSGKPVISISTLDRGQVPASEGSYEDNRWVRWINENAPVTIQVVPVLRSQSRQALDALFAAGSAPDVIWEYTKPIIDHFYFNGVIQPIGDATEKYSTVYKPYLARHPEILPYVTEEDGQIYAFTNARPDFTNPLETVIIRKDWLDKFGMEAPKNLDEMLTFMRRVRDEDPDGNGIKDTWGIGGHIQYLSGIQCWFGTPTNHTNFDMQNGQFVDWATTPGYRAYLEFMAMIYREGLIDPEYITDTQSVRQLQFWKTGKTGVFVGNISHLEVLKELRVEEPKARLVPMNRAPATEFGQFNFFHNTGIIAQVIMANKDVKNLQPIVQYIDWMMDKGAWTLTYGLEGIHYQLKNGVPVDIDTERNNRERIYINEFAFIKDPWDTLDWIKILAPPDSISQEIAQLTYDWRATVVNYNPKQFVPYAYSSDAIERYNAAITTQSTSITTNIIMGRISVDEGWRQLENMRNNNGFAAVAAEKDAWYQKNRAMFESIYRK